MAAPLFSFYSLYQPSAKLSTSVDYFFNNATYTKAPGFFTSGPGNIEFSLTEFSLPQGFLRCMWDNNGQGQTLHQPFVRLYGQTTELLRLAAHDTSSSGLARIEYWNGSAWITIGLPRVMKNLDIDIEWKIAQNGYFRLYINRTTYAEFVGDTRFTADTEIKKVGFQCASTSVGILNRFWNIHVDSDDTRGTYFAISRAGANGFSQGLIGAGGYTAVDDDPFASGGDTTFLTASQPGQKSTFRYAGIPTGLADTGVLEKVFMCAWAQAQSAPGLFLKPIVRVISTDHDINTPMVQPVANQQDFVATPIPVNPATGFAWTSIAELQQSNIEMGWQAVGT